MTEVASTRLSDQVTSRPQQWRPVELPDAIEAAIVDFGDLPTLAPVAMRILEMTQDSEVSVAELCAVIGADPGLTARIIRLANTASYYRDNQTTTLIRAASLLGVPMLKLVVLCFTLIADLRDDRVDWEYLWRRSVATGVLSRKLAALPAVTARLASDSSEVDVAETAFAAGLLSQVGHFAIVGTDGYRNMVDDHGLVQDPDLEREYLGVTVDTVTACVLDRWGLPKQFCAAIGSRYPTEATGSRPVLSQVLRAGDAAARLILSQDEGRSQVLALDAMTATAVSLGLTVGQVQEVIDDGQGELEELFAAFDFESTAFLDADDLVSAAQRQFARINMGVSTGRNVLRSTDPLTGLPNRRALETFVANQIALRQFQQSESELGVLLCQLDRFEETRALLGPMATDELIQATAGRLFDGCQATELLARLGFDRFVLAVLGSESSQNSASDTAERLRARVAAAPFVGPSSEIELTMTVGGVVSSSAEALEVDQLLIAAEAELESATSAGGNRASISALVR